MMIELLLAAAMVPPPPEGDDRTAIIAHVRSALDALLTGDEAAARAAFHPDARFDVVNERPGREGQTERRTLNQMLTALNTKEKFHEPFGIPTVLQNGRFAQVWVPYSFWRNGIKSHCGIDNVTLVASKPGEWKITTFGFTMVPTDQCDALGAPSVPEPK